MIRRPPFVINGQSGGNLYPNWNVDAYEEAVRRIVTRITASTSGRELINSLRHIVGIIPYNFVNRPNQCNAGANIHPPRDFFNVPAAITHGVNVPVGRRVIVGMGTGAATEIQYTPGFFVHGNPLFCGLAGPGTAADEVLFHELVHAAVNSAGICDPRPINAALAGYQSIDEYRAVIMTNVYSSETGRGLRGGYPGWPAMHDPIGFYARPGNQAMIDTLCTGLPVLTDQLARVPCGFNPFREYWRQRAGLVPSSARALR